MSAALLRSLFRYKAWANEELFTELAAADPTGHEDQRHLTIRLLNHVYVVDRIFAAHLKGEPHPYTRVNTDATPTVRELHNDVRELDRWYIEYIEKLPSERFAEQVAFTFTDGQKGCMSREEILAHVATHGGYHRGGVGRIYAKLEKAPPRDSFTTFLHATEPLRRERG